ncbi:MAG TPA: APC family permease [Candidatus Baltobacteraceae bacterium]|nr:APC family permease [Candidatus Baltobacteraceae bacterium]
MKPQLHRSMGLADVALFFIIASTNLQWVAASAAAGPSALFAWVAGCIALFVPLCIVVVYLARRYPREGGMYVWTTHAFGPYAGFITAWSYWFSTLPYFPGLLYFTAGAALYATGTHTAPPVYFITFAGIGMLIGTLLNVLGLQTGKQLVNVAAICRGAAIVLLMIFGVIWWHRFGFATPIDARSLRPSFDVKEIVFLSIVAFAFVGPEALPFMAEEVRDPQRSIPRGLSLAAPAIVAIYIFGTLALFALIKPANVDSLYGVVQGFASATAHLGGTPVLLLAVALVVVSCIGSLTAWIGANARLPFVAGIDAFLPPAFARLHPRYNSPVTSLYVQLAVSLVLIVLGQSGTSVKGAYDILVSCTILATMVPFALMFAAAVKLSAGNAVITIAGVVGLFTSLAALVIAAIPTPGDPAPLLAVAKIVGLNVLMLLAGTAFYALARQASRA